MARLVMIIFVQSLQNIINLCFPPNSAGVDDSFKSEVDTLLNDARSNGDNALSSPIDIAMIQQCVNSLKPREAAGPDELCNEHIMLGGVQPSVHLCLLFNAMLKHSFVPSAFHCGVIIPLLKNKHGDASIKVLGWTCTVVSHCQL